jgi:hypothetical protein
MLQYRYNLRAFVSTMCCYYTLYLEPLGHLKCVHFQGHLKCVHLQAHLKCLHLQGHLKCVHFQGHLKCVLLHAPNDEGLQTHALLFENVNLNSPRRKTLFNLNRFCWLASTFSLSTAFKIELNFFPPCPTCCMRI